MTVWEGKVRLPYNRPDRPDRPDRPNRLKERDDHMEELPGRSQTTWTIGTTSIAWIELSSMLTIGTIE